MRPGGSEVIPATSWSSEKYRPSGLKRPRARNGKYCAFGVHAEGRALAPQLVEVERPGEQREHERVPPLLLLARLLDLDLAVGSTPTTFITASAQRQRVSLKASTVATSAPCARASSPKRDHTAVIEIR